MNIDEKKLRKAINAELKKKFAVSETDLIARNQNDWVNMKVDFKNRIGNLLSNLENDEYSDAAGDIDKTIAILQQWKKKMSKDMTDAAVQEDSEE